MTNEQQPADQGRGVGEPTREMLRAGLAHLIGVAGSEVRPVGQFYPGMTADESEDYNWKHLGEERLRRAYLAMQAIAALTQPKGVTDGMVWRACKAYRPGMDSSALGYPKEMVDAMRSALESALSLPRQSEAEPYGWIHEIEWTDGWGGPTFVLGKDKPLPHIEQVPGRDRHIIAPIVKGDRFTPLYTTPPAAQGDQSGIPGELQDAWDAIDDVTFGRLGKYAKDVIARYLTPGMKGHSRIVGSRMIDGVHVIIAKPASDLLPEQLLVRYDDYLAAISKTAQAVDIDSLECAADVVEWLEALAAADVLAEADRRRVAKAAKIVYRLGTTPAAHGVGDGMVVVPVEPTEAQWSGLARDVVMWMQAYQRHDSDSLLKHLDRSGTEIPDWLRKEADTGSHSLPKGSIAAIIYKAMIQAASAPGGSTHEESK